MIGTNLTAAPIIFVPTHPNTSGVITLKRSPGDCHNGSQENIARLRFKQPVARVEVDQRKSPDAIYAGILTVGAEFLRNSYDYAAEKTDDDDTISLKGERAQSSTKCKYLR